MGLANLWDLHVMPRIIRCACGLPMIADLRRQVVPLAKGRVFELGCGGGLNQPFYKAAAISAFSGLDPSAKLLDFARKEARTNGWEADIRAGFGEALPFEDDSFDTVVSTFTLCSVSDHAKVLNELHRVLKPEGTMLYIEHGGAPEAGVSRWQRRIEPVWKQLMGNCHLTRKVTSAIANSGFTVTQMGGRFIPGTPRLAGWVEWGSAVKKC